VISSPGRTTKLQINVQAWPPDLLFDFKSNRPWVVGQLGDSTWGPGVEFYEVDWKRRQAVLRCSGADVDFWPQRGLYASVSRRSLIPYGTERTVWGRTLAVGDWRAGWERTLLKGQVLVDSVSLRP
jgi:hypothetical protein